MAFGLPRVCCCANLPSASNKPPQISLTDSSYNYLLQHTSEDKVLQTLREQTARQWPKAKQMQVSPEQGRFLSWLVASTGVTKALEIGVFTGYSALCIAKALLPGGILLGCERDERPLQLAHEAFAEACLSDKIRIEIGDAQLTLQGLLDAGKEDTFDFAFIDADKRGYQQYHEKLLRLIRRGGILIYDNMLWYGAVADIEDSRKSTVALRNFNDQLLSDPRIDHSLVQIGDGMALCRRIQ